MRTAKSIPSPKNYTQFKVIFGYLAIEKNEDESPVMALSVEKDKSSYIIPLSNAYYFANSVSGGPTNELLDLAGKIASVLCLSTDKYMQYKVVNAIVDNLAELIEMPPKQKVTHQELMNTAERHGVVVSLNGDKLLDAS